MQPISAPGCDVESCEREHYLQGLCRSHYRRKLRAGTTDGLRERNAGKECSVDGCESGAYCKTYCLRHYQRFGKYGTTDLPKREPKPRKARARKYPRPAQCQDCSEGYEQRHFNQVRCPACQSASVRKKAREYNNSAEVRERRREYYEANRDRLRAQSSARYWSDVEKSREWHRNYSKLRAEQKREYDAEYRRNHPERRAFHEQRRQARKRTHQELFSFTREQLDQRMSMFGHACWMCGGPFDHVDHVKPLSRGGIHALSNLRPACAPCNISKGARWPFEVLPAVPDLFDAAEEAA